MLKITYSCNKRGKITERKGEKMRERKNYLREGSGLVGSKRIKIVFGTGKSVLNMINNVLLDGVYVYKTEEREK